jgi:hypothetical protein
MLGVAGTRRSVTVAFTCYAFVGAKAPRKTNRGDVRFDTGNSRTLDFLAACCRGALKN